MTEIGSLQLQQQLLKWTEDHFLFSGSQDEVILTTPFVDLHNDCIEMLIEEVEYALRVTDGGQTLADLEISGVNITEQRQQQLAEVFNRIGVTCTDGEISATASLAGASGAIHSVLQGILAAQGLTFSVRPRRRQPIADEIDDVLRKSSLPYNRQVPINGKSGLSQQIDFVVRDNGRFPHHLIQTISNPDKGAMERQIFFAMDTKEQYAALTNTEPRFVAVLSDVEQAIAPSMMGALLHYDVRPVVLSEARRIDWMKFVLGEEVA